MATDLGPVRATRTKKNYLRKEIKSLEGHKDGSPLGLSIYKNFQGCTVPNFCLNEDGPDWDWACFSKVFRL